MRARMLAGKAKATTGSHGLSGCSCVREAAGHRQAVGGLCSMDLGESQRAHLPLAKVATQKANLGILTCKMPSLLVHNILGEG